MCDWGIYFGAAQLDNSPEYNNINHVCGLKIYCNSTTGGLLVADHAMRERYYATWPDSKIIAVHAEEETVLDILELVRKYRKRTHFVHISTAQEIAYLQAAKEERLPITIGVCPHHLYLTETDLKILGAFGIMKPGLKTAADRDALWCAIQSGVVDIIESDHAPHTILEKLSSTPPFGVPGLETTLPLMLLGVHEGRLTLERVVELVATNPCHIWGLSCPPDTYALVDLDASYIVERGRLHTQCRWSPFEGMRVHGQVCETWIRGRKVYDGGKVLAEPGFGHNLFS
jgi:carbamoyl-phosphate synthase/aspartate carbamoyltransferase/dihydroorotase